MHSMVPGANRGGSPTAWSTMVVGGLTMVVDRQVNGFCRALSRHGTGLQAGSVQKILDLAGSRIAGAPGCKVSATSEPVWMVTSRRIKRAGLLGRSKNFACANTISWGRVEGRWYGVAGELSAGTLVPVPH
jgi:hypothetical protein